MAAIVYSFDSTGLALQNKVIAEVPYLVHQAPAGLSAENSKAVFDQGPFYWDREIIVQAVPNDGSASFILVKGVDYFPIYQYYDATAKANQMIVGGIGFTDVTFATKYSIKVCYQCVGGAYVLGRTNATAIASSRSDGRTNAYEAICTGASIPLQTFPTVDFPWKKVNASDVKSMVQQLEQAGLYVHLRPKFLPTPDQVKFIPTADEVGLGELDNYATATDLEAVDASITNRMMTPHATALSATKVLSDKLSLMGYAVPVAYAAGINMTSSKQTVSYGDNVYAPRQSALPFTTNGAFEIDKLILVNSNDRDHWHDWLYTITGSEPIDVATGARIITMPFTFLADVSSQMVINNFVEPVAGLDYHLGSLPSNLLYLEYPHSSGDQIYFLYKRKSSRMANDRPFYKTFAVDSGVMVFPLAGVSAYDACDLRVTVNDAQILYRVSDYIIDTVAQTLTMVYPMKLGDIIEVESMDQISNLGKHQLRSLMSARTPI